MSHKDYHRPAPRVLIIIFVLDSAVILLNMLILIVREPMSVFLYHVYSLWGGMGYG